MVRADRTIKKFSGVIMIRNYSIDPANAHIMSRLEKTKPRQTLNFQLMRSGYLSPNEGHLLNIINSFSTHCIMRLRELAVAMNRSESLVKRTIRTLVAKGLIEKRYGFYKRLILRIVPLEKQKQILKSLASTFETGLMFMKNAVEAIGMKRKKFRHGAHRSSVVCSKEELNKNSSNTEEVKEKPTIKVMEKVRGLTDMQVSDERNRQLAALRAAGFTW